MTKKERNIQVQKSMEALANKEGPKFIDLLFNAFHQKDRLAILDLVNYFVRNIRSIQAIVSIRCRYALHAMLYMFRNEDRLEILNGLSKADLVALKRLIAGVQKYNVPEYEGSLGLVAEIPEDKLFSDVSNPEEEMRRKIGVIHVDVWCFWEAILPELQKWSDAITEFQQAKAEQNAAPESDKVEVEETGKNEVIPEGEKTELWSYQELADHLGLTKAQLNRR
ncbi:MAG: hypothetical protein IKZ64_03425, partial [Alphaproteobacteria bacterium]|nr:hypothetical protein [Alphaproteobacteria bacterium]